MWPDESRSSYQCTCVGCKICDWIQECRRFAGEMTTGGVAEVGKVSLIGLPITNAVSAVQTFVPVIRNSDITGFQSGMTVKATGIPEKDSSLKIEKVGYAGGMSVI